MGSFSSESFLEQLIAIQRKAILTYILFAVGLLALGIGIISLTLLYPDQSWLNTFPTSADGVKGAFSWGGAFVTSLLSLPVKEIVERRGRISVFRNLRVQLADLKSMPASKRAEIQKRLEDVMWQYVQKAALG